MEKSFSGRSDQTGLAGWGISARQPFIGRPEQRYAQLHRQQQQEFPSSQKVKGCITLKLYANNTILNSATGRDKLEMHKSVITIVPLIIHAAHCVSKRPACRTAHRLKGIQCCSLKHCYSSESKHDAAVNMQGAVCFMEDILICCRGKKKRRIHLDASASGSCGCAYLLYKQRSFKIYVVKTGISRTDGLHLFPDFFNRY